MTLDAAGNLGIGTTAPAAMLEIGGNPANAIRTAYLNVSANNGSVTDRPYIRGTTTHLVIQGGGTTSGGDIYLNYTGDGTTGSVRIRENLFVMNTGYVGIGTSGPSYPLHTYAAGGRAAYFQQGSYWPNLGWFTNGNGHTADIWSYQGSASIGWDVGVLGVAEGGSGDRLGGCFYVQSGASWPAVAAVGSVIDGTTYKIYGFGTVSTLVDDENGDSLAVMAAPEAPEVLFQDFGVGQLQNGQAHIELDPILAKNIRVDADHPIKVFIQLEGDCNGVYVTEKSASGFTVIEHSGGQSNTSFSWMITANRADETRGGVTSRYSDMRFKKTTHPSALKGGPGRAVEEGKPGH
jgi:hypothetical protein